MRITLGKAINGIYKYIENEIFPKMNDLQEVVARFAITRILSNEKLINDKISENNMLKILLDMDNEGNVNIESVAENLKSQLTIKEKIIIPIPLFGKLILSPADIDLILNYIKEN